MEALLYFIKSINLLLILVCVVSKSGHTHKGKLFAVIGGIYLFVCFFYSWVHKVISGSDVLNLRCVFTQWTILLEVCASDELNVVLKSHLHNITFNVCLLLYNEDMLASL